MQLDNTSFVMVFCTCPDEITAERVALQIVEKKQAACLNIIPGIKSIYRWQDKIETSNEVLLIIKTSKANYNGLESLLKDLHPYQCPEIIGVPIEHGNIGYLQWLKTNTSL